MAAAFRRGDRRTGKEGATGEAGDSSRLNVHIASCNRPEHCRALVHRCGHRQAREQESHGPAKILWGAPFLEPIRVHAAQERRGHCHASKEATDHPLGTSYAFTDTRHQRIDLEGRVAGGRDLHPQARVLQVAATAARPSARVVEHE